MPKTRQQKENILTKASKSTKESKSLVFIGYHGLSVPEFEELRKDLRKDNVKVEVIKKTLLKKALESAGMDSEVKNLGEGLAVAYAMGDEVSAPKILTKYKKTNDKLQIYGGILESKFVQEDTIVALSKILSRPELYAKLVGSLNSPVSSFVRTISGVTTGFVRALDGIRQSKS